MNAVFAAFSFESVPNVQPVLTPETVIKIVPLKFPVDELMKICPPVNVPPKEVVPPVTFPEASKEIVILKGPNIALLADPVQVPSISV